MLKIAICDDERIFIDILHSHLKPIFNAVSSETEFETFQSAVSLLRAFNTTNFDVVFLDIDMPGMSGFEVAKAIRDISYYTLIIFVTSKHELVYNSFDYNPFYFICKGDSLESDLSHVAEKVSVYFRQHKNIEITDIVAGKVSISLRSILYIKSEKHYLLYYLNNGDDVPLKERGVLGKKEEELYDYNFFKPHQRYLVNMNHVRRFDSLINSITLSNGYTIPISKGLKADALEKFRIFKRR